MFFGLGVLKYVVGLYNGCCVFCLYCEAWSCRCSCMESVTVSSCRCCMFVSCVYPVAILNAAFYMTFSIFNAGRVCKRRPYGRGILQSRSHDCLIGSHECLLLFTPSCCSEYFMICKGLCACTEMLWMCVIYVCFGSKVRSRTFGRVTIGSELLFIVRSRFLVYSAGPGVNRVQVVLSGFSMILFCFVQTKTLCRYGCKYFFAALVLVCVCVDVMVMSSASAMI